VRILDTSAFVEQVLASTPPLPPPAPHCDGTAVLASLCTRVSAACGIAAAELTSGSQRPVAVAARQLISHLAVAHYGLPTRTIATALRISPQSVRRGIVAGRQLLEKAQSTGTQLLSSNWRLAHTSQPPVTSSSSLSSHHACSLTPRTTIFPNLPRYAGLAYLNLRPGGSAPQSGSGAVPAFCECTRNRRDATDIVPERDRHAQIKAG
jgi:hypothetical protein